MNRLSPFLEGMIIENHSAFVARRQIHDNIMVAQEVYHYLKKEKERKEGGYGIKVGYEQSL